MTRALERGRPIFYCPSLIFASAGAVADGSVATSLSHVALRECSSRMFIQEPARAAVARSGSGKFGDRLRNQFSIRAKLANTSNRDRDAWTFFITGRVSLSRRRPQYFIGFSLFCRRFEPRRDLRSRCETRYYLSRYPFARLILA